MKLDAFIRDVYVPLRLRGRSRNSVRLLDHAARQFGRWLGRPATLDDLEDLAVASFLTARAARVSPHSVERERCGLLALWRLAADRGLVQTRPTVTPTPLPRRNPTAWTHDEIRRLVSAARETTGRIGVVDAAVWWPALIGLCWESAERIGAVLATAYADLIDSTLVMRAETRKGGRSDRVVHLTTETAAAARAAHDPARDVLLWWPHSTPSIYDHWHRIARRAGLDGRRAAFHQIRRSVATAYAAAGGNATALLDHADARTTRAYLDRRYIPAIPPPASMLPPIG